MITHDPEDLEWFGERALYIRDGSIVAPPTAPIEESTASLLQV